MKKICDICGEKLGFYKFRYDEGVICKACYKKASKNFVETIRHKTYHEIKSLCEEENTQLEQLIFEKTGKVGNYILLDDKNKQLCIPHNRANESERKQVEFVLYEDINKIQLSCVPDITEEELSNWEKNKEKKVITSLEIFIYTKTRNDIRKIIMLSSPVRVNSFAFRRIFAFTKKILKILNEIQEKNEKSEENKIEENYEEV